MVEFHNVNIERLHDTISVPNKELEFFLEANDLLVSCRSTAKWTYAYAYYNINEKTEKNRNKKETFEFAQTNLENYTQRLHEYLKEDCSKFMDITDKRPFYDYRSKVKTLAEALSKFRDGIVKEIQNDDAWV